MKRSLVAIAGVMVFLGSGCQSWDGRPSPVPSESRIESSRAGFIGYIGEDGNVRTVDQGSDREIALTDDAGVTEQSAVAYSSPTWSPDGRHIVFVGQAFQRETSTAVFSLHMADRNGEGVIQLFSSTRLRPFYLYWSPDGQWISFLSQVAGSNLLELGMVRTELGGSYVKLDSGQPFYWSWERQGERIIVHANGSAVLSPNARLSVLELEGDPKRRDFDALPTNFQAPALSPDGRTAFYVSVSESGSLSNLVSQEIDGLETSVLATEPGTFYFSLSQDGDYLAYINERGGGFSQSRPLHVVELGTGQTRYSHLDLPVLAHFWSPDSRKLAFLVPRGLAGESLDPSFAENAQLLYVGLNVLDLENGEVTTVAMFPATPGLLNILPFFDQYHASLTIWSPDSEHLVFTAYTNQGSPGVFIVAMDGAAEPRFMGAGDHAFWSMEKAGG
jgi:dipeptidyl aminopeptidase/acylaminoacyl peptidase